MTTSRGVQLQLEGEIEARFGVLPSFFQSSAEPEVVEQLWSFAKAAYLDSPIPSLFKERLFVYLSRFCEVRYCIVRHCGFLMGRGRPSGDPDAKPMSVEDVLSLLRRPGVTDEQVEAYLVRLESLESPLESWPEPDTTHESMLFSCATVVFLEPGRSERCRQALRRTLGSRRFELLTAFLGFVRLAHFWTLTHPELEFEPDVEALLREHEELARCLLEDPEAGRCEMGERLFNELLMLRDEKHQLEELRRTKRALEERDRQKDEFLAVLGHELRNPLAVVRTVSEFLSAVQLDDPRLRRARERLRRQSEHMVRMVDDILDVSRLTHGKVSLERTELNLADVVGDVLQEFRQQMEASELALDIEIPSHEVPVFGDRVRLHQVVDNLLSNALKFTAAPGRISVRVSENAGHAQVMVEDSGVGFDEATGKKLFEPFLQGQQDLDRSRGGIGLGLAISKMLIDLHGGTLEAQSDGVEGARFTLTLPLLGDRFIGAHRPEPVSSAPRRILIIEDNPDVADGLADLLELEGHDITIAHDGASGLERVYELRPDIVFCDLGLPGSIDGFEVARVCRREPVLCETRLVALTGYGRPEDRRRAEAAGFDLHMPKPPDLKSLARVLSELE